MIKIIPYSPIHQSGVVAVIVPIQQQEFGVAVTLAEQPDLLDIPGFYQQGAGNFWIAVCNDEVIGTVALLDIGNGQVALRKMFVKAAYRGAEHGVARGLLGVLLQWCARHSIREIYLGTTAKFLAAHRFYEKNGFQDVTEAELPKAFPIMNVDTKFYRCRLSG